MRLTNAFFLRPAACCCCSMWDILDCEKPEKPRIIWQPKCRIM